jgi:hypothetical protein
VNKPKTPSRPSKQDASARASALVTKAEAAGAARVTLARKLIADIRQQLGRVARTFWELGRALKTMRDKKLHGALGYASFEAMVDGEKLGSDTLAYKLITVVENVPKREAVRLGYEKAAALVSYVKATPEEDSAAELARSDALIGGKRLSKSSVREVEAHKQAVKAKAAASKPKTAAEVARAKADAALLKRVKSQLAEAGLRKATIAIRGSKVVIEVERAAFEA